MDGCLDHIVVDKVVGVSWVHLLNVVFAYIYTYIHAYIYIYIYTHTHM